MGEIRCRLSGDDSDVDRAVVNAVEQARSRPLYGAEVHPRIAPTKLDEACLEIACRERRIEAYRQASSLTAAHGLRAFNDELQLIKYTSNPSDEIASRPCGPDAAISPLE